MIPQLLLIKLLYMTKEYCTKKSQKERKENNTENVQQRYNKDI